MTTNRPPHDRELDSLLHELPRTERPSSEFTSHVMSELRRRDLVGRTPHRGRALLAASVVFAAGLTIVLTVGRATSRRATTTTIAAVRQVSPTGSASPAAREVPALGHSEVWF